MSENGVSSFWRQLAVITGLSAVAFVAPVLDIYGRNPEVFVANRTSGFEMILFALLVALVVPSIATIVLFVAGRFGHRAQAIAYRVLVGVLGLLAGLVVARQVFDDNTVVAVLLALAIAGAVYWLTANIESVFVWAALAVPILVVFFVTSSDSARLISEGPATTNSGIEVGAPEHLVMIQLDEMPLASIMTPEGSINDDLFPGFAKLADEGTWYRNALSDSIATTQSVPAILTGQRVEKGLSPSHVDHPDNLFTLLADSHEMHVIEWVAELCPEEICPEFAGRSPARFGNLLADVGVVYAHLTFPGDTRDSLPSIGNAWRGFLGQSDEVTGDGVAIEGLPVPPDSKRPDWIDWVQRLINGIRDGTRPTLSYAHLRTPHVPWGANPSGTHYDRPEEYTEVFGVEGDGRWSTNGSDSLVGLQRHLMQIGFLDTMLLRLLDHIEESGTWDDTMIVVVADHGASFTPGEHRRWPYDNNRDDLYRVPLLIKYPNQTESTVVDTPTFGIDLLPTVVDVMDVTTDWSFDGESLLTVDTVREHEPIRWCCNGAGVSTDLDPLFAQVDLNHMRIPDQTSWTSILAVGEDARLMSTDLLDMDLTVDSSFSFSVDLGSDLDNVDRDSGEVQTLLTGRVETTSTIPDQLLIAINDTVAGVAHVTRDSEGGGSFIGLVPEEMIDDGVNEILLLAREGDAWSPGTRSDLSIVLTAPDGHEIEVKTEGSLRVQVDKVEETSAGFKLTGWGADTGAKVPPTIVYVFAGDQLISAVEPDIENGNVVAWFDSEELRLSGFELEIDTAELPQGVSRVLVVAEFENGAVADSVSLSPTRE